jgi:hypothetical protein
MDKERIENDFTYHAPKGTQQARYELLRAKGKELALQIESSCPDSEDKRYALHYLNIAIMSANASIARNE